MIGWLERWQIPLYLVALGAGAACGSGITEPTPCPRSRAKARVEAWRGDACCTPASALIAGDQNEKDGDGCGADCACCAH